MHYIHTHSVFFKHFKAQSPLIKTFKPLDNCRVHILQLYSYSFTIIRLYGGLYHSHNVMVIEYLSYQVRQIEWQI